MIRFSLTLLLAGVCSIGMVAAQNLDPVASNPIAVTYNDYARFFAGLPLRPDSPLQSIVGQPAVRKHSNEARDLSQKWEDSRLAKIRKWAKAEVHPKIARPTVLKYMFGGPDFVHAATMFPGVPEYVQVGLEPLGGIPDFFRMTNEQVDSYLTHLNYTLRSISRRNFFITTEMREDFGKDGVDGVFPVLLSFAAMTGHDVIDAKYVKLNAAGKAEECSAGEAIGIWMQLRLQNASPTAPAVQNLYYFKTDLSNSGFQAGSPFHRFLSERRGGGAYLKAASYLMHTEDFSNIRNFLVGDCDYVVQDASGIPSSFFSQYYNVEYYGNYVGPIDMFSEYDQPDLRAIYQSGVAKPLPFGTGYRMRDQDSVQMLGLRK